jgi:hypothetical protein
MLTLELERTLLRIDGSWQLEELSDATRDYLRLYGFAYSVLPGLPSDQESKVHRVYGRFPWRRGYSTIHFFHQLFRRIPEKLRPSVQRIRFESPGFIELREVLIVAASVAAIVKAVCASINTAHDTYRRIQKGMKEHQLAKIDVTSKQLELTERQLEFCERESATIARILDLSDEQEAVLDKRLDSNLVMKLKILLSVYRRVELLAKKQAEGKIQVTAERSNLPEAAAGRD